MKKYVVSSIVVGAIVLYILYQHVQGPSAIALAPSTPASSSSKSTAAASGSQTAPSQSSSSQTTPSAPTSLYKNGTYTGVTANAFYGPMQVAAVIRGGQLASVKVLQYPQSHSYSQMVNGEALPYLKSEAVQAQNANINIVSGATASSQAFMQSLSSALSQATNG